LFFVGYTDSIPGAGPITVIFFSKYAKQRNILGTEITLLA